MGRGNLNTSILAHFLLPYGNYKSFHALYTVLTISNSVPFPESLLPVFVCVYVCARMYTCARTHTHTHLCASLQFISTVYIHELFSDPDLNFPPL